MIVWCNNKQQNDNDELYEADSVASALTRLQVKKNIHHICQI